MGIMELLCDYLSFDPWTEEWITSRQNLELDTNSHGPYDSKSVNEQVHLETVEEGSNNSREFRSRNRCNGEI